MAAREAPGSEVHLHMPGQHRASPSGKVVKATDAHSDGATNAWASQCVSPARHDVPDCSVEQRVFLRESGRLLASATVSLRHGTNKPTILVQVPLGLALDRGITLKLDNRRPIKMRVQTCDQSGCYAATVMSRSFLRDMRNSEKLTVRFVASNHKPIVVPMSLKGFAAAYKNIQ